MTQNVLWRPPPFEAYHSGDSIDRAFGPNLDLALQTTLDSLDTANGQIANLNGEVATLTTEVTTLQKQIINRVELPANVVNQAIASGSQSVTGSVNGVATGLSAVSNVVGTLDNGTTATNYWLSVRPSVTVGAIDIFVWMPTSTASTVPIAATAAVTVRWIAFGTQ